ncbi:MAG: hypothetical protein EON89_12845 [Brevundimonas sp.]|nr:MAG: hypothetical protein EON89_12845 [Brevundimonas sp.]
MLRIAAIGDGDTDIDLIVRDPRGRTLCTDSLRDHYPVCTLRPSQAAQMRIEVVNRGGIVTRVQILTN